MHPVARVLLIGSSGQESPLYKLNGQSDILGSIWQALVRTWTFELLEATLEKNDSVAFAHVQNVDFPEPKGRHVNMMPFVSDDVKRWAKQPFHSMVHGIWHIRYGILVMAY